MLNKFIRVSKSVLNIFLLTDCRHYEYYIYEIHNLADELRDKIDW